MGSTEPLAACLMVRMLSVIRDEVTVMLDLHYRLLKLFNEENKDTFFMD